MVFGFAKQSGGSVDVRSEEGRGHDVQNLSAQGPELNAQQLPAQDDGNAGAGWQ